MARERTYFKQISLFRARYIYVPCNRLPLISGCVRVSTYLPAATTTSRRDATRLGCLLEEDCACPFFLFFLSFLPRVAEFKRFKAISLGVADRCWSTADWASPSSIRLVSPRFFSVSKFLSNYDRVTMMLFLSPFFHGSYYLQFVIVFHSFYDLSFFVQIIIYVCTSFSKTAS